MKVRRLERQVVTKGLQILDWGETISRRLVSTLKNNLTGQGPLLGRRRLKQRSGHRLFPVSLSLKMFIKVGAPKMNRAFIFGFICAPILMTQGMQPMNLAATEPTARANASSGVAAAAAGFQPVAAHGTPAPTPASLGISFVENSTSSVLVEREGKEYIVDLAARTIREVTATAVPAAVSSRTGAAESLVRAADQPTAADQPRGADIFNRNCSRCHGPDGKGIPALRTPDFTSGSWQAGISDGRILETIKNGKKGTAMPAWGGKLSEQDIVAVRAHIRSFGSARPGQKVAGGATQAKVYQPGDDVLMSLPTGRRLERHGFYVNFSHRFAFDPAFSGTARGAGLLGLDGLALSSFGFRYGVTDKLSVSIYRSPSLIGRPIQMMTAYNFLDEHDGRPLNAAVRLSIEGEDNFAKNFTENLELIFSRSLGHRAQLYFVPTGSLNARRLFIGNSFESSAILAEPGVNTLSLGAGGSFDIRPSVALVAEVIPTVVHGRDLGILRPAYAFGIQKKIWRHAFTFGFTNSPGTTVSQRAGTRAAYLNDPTADKPSGLVIGFDLTRQIY
jgi:mono/diheme cytochrome c family protein